MFRFKENLDSERAFFFYYGRVALYALLKAIGVTEEDEILLQVFTCFQVPFPIVRLKCRPVYVDIDPATLSMDPLKIEEKITSKTKAIVVQHTYGIPAEMDRIMEIAGKYKLWVIEDCCHALGSTYMNKEVGTFGDAAFYSFGWRKPISIGTGGAAVINNSSLLSPMNELNKQFVTPSPRELIPLTIQSIAYELAASPKLFSTMRKIYRNQYVRKTTSFLYGNIKDNNEDNVGTYTSGKLEDDLDIYYKKKIISHQEKRLYKKLEGFNEMLNHQKWIVDEYKKEFEGSSFNYLTLDSRFNPVFYKYPLFSRIKPDIYHNLDGSGIELSDMFRSPVFSTVHKDRWESLGYTEGMCPISEKIANEVIPLSVHSKINQKTIKKTSAYLNNFQ